MGWSVFVVSLAERSLPVFVDIVRQPGNVNYHPEIVDDRNLHCDSIIYGYVYCSSWSYAVW